MYFIESIIDSSKRSTCHQIRSILSGSVNVTKKNFQTNKNDAEPISFENWPRLQFRAKKALFAASVGQKSGRWQSEINNIPRLDGGNPSPKQKPGKTSSQGALASMPATLPIHALFMIFFPLFDVEVKNSDAFFLWSTTAHDFYLRCHFCLNLFRHGFRKVRKRTARWKYFVLLSSFSTSASVMQQSKISCIQPCFPFAISKRKPFLPIAQ